VIVLLLLRNCIAISRGTACLYKSAGGTEECEGLMLVLVGLSDAQTVGLGDRARQFVLETK